MIENYKIGIFHWFGYILPFEERIKLIKQAGYDYVMLWWEDESYPYTINRMKFNEVLKSYDLKLDNVHLPFDNINNLWSEESYNRNNEIYVLKKWLNECKKSGVDTVVMHTTQGNNNNFNYNLGYESFKSLINEAENIDIKIALENTQMFEYTDFILKEISSSNVGFCYDSSHDFVNGGSCGEILQKWKEKLIAVHLSDNDGLCDRHWIPGKGHVDWKKIINMIKQTNIKSYSMETYPFELEKDLEPHDFLEKAKKDLRTVVFN
jgi:sugar phosphate isomerase/epimerase